MTPKRGIAATKAITLLPWIFIVIVAVIAYQEVRKVAAVFSDYSRQNTGNMYTLIEPSQLISCLATASSGSGATNNNVLAVSPEALKLCLADQKAPSKTLEEIFKPRVDEMKWMLTVIASIAAFFAIAQTGAAWFTALIYTKQAEESLKGINAIQADVKARYPLFEKVEAARNNAFKALDQVFSRTSKSTDKHAGSTEALDWKDNLYRELRIEDRQQLLSAESFVSIDLDRGPFSDEKHADLLRKFALFYRAKFLFEENLNKGSISDLERAESYLNLAFEKDRDFTFLNDLGSVYTSYYSTLRQKGVACRRSGISGKGAEGL